MPGCANSRTARREEVLRDARVTSFSRASISLAASLAAVGVLVVATDGLFKYAVVRLRSGKFVTQTL
jgi:hypothetical protein